MSAFNSHQLVPTRRSRKLALSLLLIAGIAVAVTARLIPESSPRLKVIMIGLDGVPWKVLRPLMDSGRAPSLASLARSGTRGNMLTKGDGSPAKWTTMATGLLPEKHGINGFQVFEEGRMVALASYHRRADAVWNYVSEAERSVGVVHYQVGWPPEEVNGYVVTKQTQDRTYPPGIDLSREVHPIKDFLPSSECDTEIRQKVKTHLAQMSGELSLAAALRQRYPTDLFIAYTHATDSMEHHFWKYLEPEVFQSRYWQLTEGGINCFGGTIPTFLEATDRVIARILANRDDNTVVIVASDHGMEPKPTEYINPIFLYDDLYAALGLVARDEQGQLEPGRPHFVSVDPHVYDLKEWGRLVLPEGTDEEVRLSKLAETVRLLRALTVQPSGEPLFKSVEPRGDGSTYSGAPPEWDIAIAENKGNKRDADRLSIEIGGQRRVLEDFVRRLGLSGMHTPESKGIFLASGRCIKSSKELVELKGVDMMPTLLHILGVAIPRGLDGRVMEEIFERDWLEEHPVTFQQQRVQIRAGGSKHRRKELNEAEQEAALEQLRALGYIQ